LGAPAPYTFAYPCGVTWVDETQDSYVPLVEERFLAARLAGPASTTQDVDLLLVPSQFDLKTSAELIAKVDEFAKKAQWLVLGFHGIGGDWLVTELEEHNALLDNLAERNDVWVAPFGQIAACVKAAR